jgi:uncharacterized membrane protein YfcA
MNRTSGPIVPVMDTAVLIVVVLGVAAGVLTTVAGLGGGMLLVLAMSAIWDPATALAVTAPALLVGNAHRLWLDRASLDRKVAGAFAAGALPGALAGGLLAVTIPDVALRALFVGATAFAIGRELGWVKLSPRPGALVPLAAAGGAVTATSGGGALIVSPLLLSTGLRGVAFVATSSAVAIAMHIGRIAAYGIGGWIDGASLVTSGILATAILAGNHLGHRLRGALDDRTTTRVTYGTLVAAVALAVVGIAR